MTEVSPSSLIVSIFFGILEKEKKTNVPSELGQDVDRAGPGVDRGRRGEAAFPSGQAIQNPV